MEQISWQSLKALNRLYEILDAGEKGYAVAAANVNNRALKMLFKTYAKRRADFKVELRGYTAPPTKGFWSLITPMAMIHRGRINIFAALTIGEQNRERVVTKEVLVGEDAAQRAYRRVLRTTLPDDLKISVEHQYAEVQGVVVQVQKIQGINGRQLVLRLFDKHQDAARAVQLLKNAHYDPISIEKVAIEQETEFYSGARQNAVLETILSGATGGAMWGSVSGALAGLGVLHLPGLGLEHAPPAIQEFAWALTALSAIVAGAFVGAVLGMFIGWGIQGADAYLHNDSHERGQVLLKLETEPDKAAQAAQIMAQVNWQARSESRHVLA